MTFLNNDLLKQHFASAMILLYCGDSLAGRSNEGPFREILMLYKLCGGHERDTDQCPAFKLDIRQTLKYHRISFLEFQNRARE